MNLHDWRYRLVGAVAVGLALGMLISLLLRVADDLYVNSRADDAARLGRRRRASALVKRRIRRLGLRPDRLGPSGPAREPFSPATAWSVAFMVAILIPSLFVLLGPSPWAPSVAPPGPKPTPTPSSLTYLEVVLFLATALGLCIWSLITKRRDAKLAVNVMASVAGSIGLIALAENWHLIGEFALLKDVHLTIDSLVHVSIPADETVTPPPQPIGPSASSAICPPDLSVHDFGVGWKTHLADSMVPRGAPEPSGEDPKIGEAVLPILKAAGEHPDTTILLIGSTDRREYHKGGMNNADLAAARANKVQSLLRQDLKDGVKVGVAPRIFVLNTMTPGGMARPVLGPLEIPGQRKVLVCLLWGNQPYGPTKAELPPRSQRRPSVRAALIQGGIIGFVLAVLLVWAPVIQTLRVLYGKARADREG